MQTNERGDAKVGIPWKGDTVRDTPRDVFGHSKEDLEFSGEFRGKLKAINESDGPWLTLFEEDEEWEDKPTTITVDDVYASDDV